MSAAFVSHRLKWQMCDLWLFSIVKLIFFKSIGWISSIKISQNSFKFSNGVSEKYLGFSSLLRRSGKLIMPGIVVMELMFVENF